MNKWAVVLGVGAIGSLGYALGRSASSSAPATKSSSSSRKTAAKETPPEPAPAAGETTPKVENRSRPATRAPSSTPLEFTFAAAVPSSGMSRAKSGVRERVTPRPEPRASNAGPIFKAAPAANPAPSPRAAPPPPKPPTRGRWVRAEPTAGFLYQVVPSDTLESIARSLLASRKVPATDVNVELAMDLLRCSPYNDALYGDSKVQGAAGLVMAPVHADNQRRLLEGLPLRRSMKHGGHDGTGGHLPLLYVVDVEPGTPVVVVAQRPDGSSGVNPNADVLELGFENLGPPPYGCLETGLRHRRL